MPTNPPPRAPGWTSTRPTAARTGHRRKRLPGSPRSPTGCVTPRRTPPSRRPVRRSTPRPSRRRSRRGARLAAQEIVANLNPEQARAVTTTDGPLLILAGAGSGKTRVVAHRIAYLIGVKAVQPRRILAVTFTNRAAGELRERIAALTGDVGKDVEAGTFHALCARVLRRDGEAIGLERNFVIYDTDDQQQLMKRILAEQDLPATGEYRPAAVLGAISRAKNEMLDADFLAAERHQPPRARDRPARRRATTSGSGPPAPSTSTTCCSRRSSCSSRRPRCSRATRPAGATSTWTSTRTRTARSTCGSGRWPPRTATCASSATTTSRSTAGAAPTSRTSSTSSATTPTRRSSSWSRTTAPRS